MVDHLNVLAHGWADCRIIRSKGIRSHRLETSLLWRGPSKVVIATLAANDLVVLRRLSWRECKGILDLQSVAERIFNLDNLLDHSILLNRRSAERAKKGCAIGFEVLREVVEALLVELMRFITG